jgi:hypothetical protein
MPQPMPLNEPGPSGSGGTRLDVVPITLRAARTYVDQHHRHHPAPPGGLFAAAVFDTEDQIRGVIIVGRPVARHYQDGRTAEVTRCCTDGARNACSMLYAAAWRAARALGYRRLITYTQAGESGASLRAAGWRVIAQRPPHAGWDRPSRPRGSAHPTDIARTLWEAA